MVFEIIWPDSVRKSLKKLGRPIAKRIYEKVSELGEEPYHIVTKLVGSPYFRLRVGDYRVIIDIRRDEYRIIVLKVGHRKIIYK